MAFGYSFLNGFAAGTALAPTSVGIALRLLHEARALQTYFGQAIITAAFVDDILSLILFNVLFSLKGDMTLMTFMPLIGGILFMCAAALLGATIWPKAIAWALARIPDRRADTKLTHHHEFLFVLMLLVLFLYAQITHLCGTHLWGCFLAGMSFSMWKEAHHVWVRQTKRITCWMIRIFFAATVAFAIPVKELLSLDAFLKGAVMGIGPCILTKVLCAPFMGDARWVIGWAMVGRAEFAYLIAQMAAASNMMEPAVFSIVIWALLWATVFAPLVFRLVLNKYVQRKAQEAQAAAQKDSEEGVNGQAVEPAKSRAGSAMAAERSGTARAFFGPSYTVNSGHLPDFYDEEQRERQASEAERTLELEAENARLRQDVARLEAGQASLQAELERRPAAGEPLDGGSAARAVFA